jgi:hypothetical protein
MHNQYVDVLAYEGLFKTCIEYDDGVHIKNCTVYCKYNIYMKINLYTKFHGQVIIILYID